MTAPARPPAEPQEGNSPDEILRRMLNTPPKPKAPSPSKDAPNQPKP